MAAGDNVRTKFGRIGDDESKRDYVGGPFFVHSGTLAFGNESALGIYGLISTIGEP
jgi:hypothetical protein